MPLSIISWGGIGDTLRNLSLVPHEALFRRFGIRSRVYYVHWKKTGALAHALPPEAAFFEEIVSRCPSLRWCGEVEGHRGAGRWVNRALREAIKKLNGNTPRYFPFEIPLTESERAALPAKSSDGWTLGIQTHLSGMKTKRWGIENWRAVLEGLLCAYPDLSIRLFDSDPQVESLCTNLRIQNTRGLNICQSIHWVGECDFLISVDSWSKYVAAWQRIPQLILVPDQRSEYPGLTPQKLVHEEFAGIFGNPRNTIIGLSGPAQAPTLSLKNIAELSPEVLLQQIQKCVSALKPVAFQPRSFSGAQ